MNNNTVRTSSEQTLNILRKTLFYVSMPLFILGLMLPVYGKQIGSSVLEIGLFFAACSFISVLLRPIVGWGLDRFGRRIFFISGLAGYTLTMISFAFIDQPRILLMARISQGIASSFLWLSVAAMTADVASDQGRGQAFGGNAQASSRGAIVGTFIGFTLLNAFLRININGQITPLNNWMILFLVYGAINLFAFFIALRRLPETRIVAKDRNPTPIHWSQTWMLLLLVTLVTAASSAMISPILIIFLQEKLGIGIEALSWAFLPQGLVWALLPSRLGKLADRFGRKPMMLLGLGAAAVSSLIIPMAGSLVALALLWAFQAVCYAAGDPAEQALVADLTGRQQRGRAYGLYVMCADLGAAIGPLGGAWLYQSYGSSTPFFVNGIILALSGLVLLFFLKIPGDTSGSPLPVS